jgi:uncharacterized membrane protein
MGIKWIFELIYEIVDESNGLWLVMEIMKCIKGIIILLILVVFRKKEISEIVKNRKWGFKCNKKWEEGVDEEYEKMMEEEEEI